MTPLEVIYTVCRHDSLLISVNRNIIFFSKTFQKQIEIEYMIKSAALGCNGFDWN